MKLSVSTIVEAYQRLIAEGAIIARPGSGYYVRGTVTPLVLTKIGPKLDREIDPLWISRQSLETDDTILKPGCGWLPASWIFEKGIRRAIRSVARLDPYDLSEYATPLGHPGLRQVLVRRMAANNINITPEQIMLTDSGTQAIDLICRFFLKPGDTVLVDDPCYFNFHALLKVHRVHIVSVTYTPNGPDIQEFARVLKDHSPKLYITNSAIHNPTGAVLSPVIAHQLLKLADQSDLVIVEDDIFADFENSPAPRLSAFDGLSRVIHIGSFSKSISASIRCGYIATRNDWLEDLADIKIATSFGSTRLSAHILHQVLTDSSYQKHMEATRLKLAEAMEKTITQLKPIGIVPWLVPQSGMFLWCKLPKGIDATAVARSCLKSEVILAPGNAFSQSLSASSFLRFNVSQSSDTRIFSVLEQALNSYIM